MCVMLPWGWNVKWLGIREMSGGTWPREAINVELIHWDIKFKWKPLTSCNPRMKKAWRYLRPETMPFQHSETCLNFLSPSFSSHNAPPWLGRLTCGKMKKKKISLNLICTGKLEGNRSDSPIRSVTLQVHKCRTAGVQKNETENYTQRLVLSSFGYRLWLLQHLI